MLVRYFLLDYDPDLIVLNVDMTDVSDDWRYRRTMVVDDEGLPWAVPPTEVFFREFVTGPQGVARADLGARLRFFLASRSHLYLLLRKLLRKGSDERRQVRARRREVVREGAERARDDELRHGWCQHAWTAETEGDVRFSMKLLGHTLELCRRRGVRTLVTGVPWHQQFTPARQGPGPFEWSLRPHRELERVAREHGAVFLDSRAALAPLFEGSAPGEYYYGHDPHLNAAGNRACTEAQLEVLLDPASGLLPPPMVGEDS